MRALDRISSSSHLPQSILFPYLEGIAGFPRSAVLRDCGDWSRTWDQLEHQPVGGERWELRLTIRSL